jgi:hypothetical protein
MKKISKNRFKRHSQIFNLKGIMNNLNNESQILMSKITELQKIFKGTKKIINEKINELAKIKNNNLTNIKEDQIKQQICLTLNSIIKKYNQGKTITSINAKKEEYRKKLKEKENNLRLVLKKLQYKKLQNEKDLLIQTIQEKKNICDNLKKQIEYEKDLINIFQPKNITFFDNLYDLNNELLKVNLTTIKKKEILDLQNHANINLKEKGLQFVNELKERKQKYISKLNEYIKDKEFNCVLSNKRYKEKYDIKIELIDEYEFSSDSESDIDEEESNKDINYPNIKIVNENKHKKKNIFMSLSEKETCDHDKEKDVKNYDNLFLINKLVEIKEKYNKLMNERFEFDIHKNSIKKKIMNINMNHKGGRNTCSTATSSSAKTFKYCHNNNNNNKTTKNFVFN